MSEDEFLEVSDSFATLAVHSGVDPDDPYCCNGIMPPIILSTTFKQNVPPGGHRGYEYAREGNPTRTSLEQRIASLQDMKHCITVSSGMAASNLFFQLVSRGDHVLAQRETYFGSFDLLNTFIKERAEVEFVNVSQLNSLDIGIRPETRFLWLETPTNPLMQLVDLKKVIQFVKQKAPNIIVAVDNTFMSPYFQKPNQFGADVVMHSCTKYIGGHSDVLMGALCINDDQLYETLKNYVIKQGPAPSAFDCYLTLRSLMTMEIRMKKHMSNATAVAKFMDSHPAVEKVFYPGIKSHSQYKLSLNQTSGCSGMMGVYIKGHDQETTSKFLGKLKLITIATSLGGPESTVIMPSMMPPGVRTEEDMKKQGITHGLLRFSIGIETEKDLLNDLKQALDYIV